MIVVNDAFVYIHHPKTGGTFVTEMLRKIASENNGFSILELPGLKHAGINKIPEQYRGLPVVMNVRNVFEHYVSRYKFEWWAEPKHAKNMFNLEKVAKVYPSFPKLTFTQFLRLFNDWSLRGRMPEKRVDELTRLNIGLNTWVLARLTTLNPMKLLEKIDQLKDEPLKNNFRNVYFLKTENLNADLYHLLKETGVAEEKINFIMDAPPILPQKGGRGKRELTWKNHFNQEDIDFVMEKDRMYFRLFPDLSEQ